MGLKIKEKIFCLWLRFLGIVKKQSQLVSFGASLLWVITQAYFYVILDGNFDYSFNTKLKLKYSMERIVIKIKLETERKIIYTKNFALVLVYCILKVS